MALVVQHCLLPGFKQSPEIRLNSSVTWWDFSEVEPYLTTWLGAEEVSLIVMVPFVQWLWYMYSQDRKFGKTSYWEVIILNFRC